jgi:glycosyltransferase involved in cell wall biosynthesis
MLLENHFPEDVRVRQEAYTLVEAGYKVSVIAQFSRKGEKFHEIVNGVTVYRIPLVEIFGKSTKKRKADSIHTRFRHLVSDLKSVLGYLLEYLYFTGTCLLLSLVIIFRESFDVIHLHNPPNSPFVIGLFYRLFGKKFVFDHHDLAPELYLSRTRVDKSIIHRILLLEEALCLRSANMVIATNESYKEIDIQRGKKRPDSIFVVRNGPDLRQQMFHAVPPDQELQAMGKKILVYIGVMGPQDGVDYLVRALYKLVHEVGRRDFFCLIIGHGEELEYLKTLSHDLQMEQFIRFTGFIPKADLIRYVSTADICLDPNPSSPLNDYSTWVKVLEYMAFCKPIISFDLKETRYSAGEAAVYVRPNDELEYAKAIAKLMDAPEQRKRMSEFGYNRMREHLSWEHVSKNLLKGYEWLFSQ